MTPLFLITKSLTLGIPWTSNKSDPPSPYCTDQETGTKRGNDLIRLKGPGTGTKVSWLTSPFSTLGPISGTLWHRNQHVKISVWDTALESTISPTFFIFSFLLDSFFSHFSLPFYSSISPFFQFPFFPSHSSPFTSVCILEMLVTPIVISLLCVVLSTKHFANPVNPCTHLPTSQPRNFWVSNCVCDSICQAYKTPRTVYFSLFLFPPYFL